ncbi:UDP-4-amino-4,6-dideoxy-N-acetyl-beta-L-altrosamine transaminase [Thalassospira sp. GB04J01]|uniref:UDP-4-amino-4, 6-dideoxy-N-acetyl-beta-L-altrosamine transaminase n=1 Tax=Thalassospira sp. GB04J01 TaxID=1485225 RepID=UPI000C9BD28D|nr:UDP-4-amino-4,6-dideoxy-N-acetyl-beta-L-altrosamine transaminase [Thalassospira sp. GB04J01]|tara:strand:+ start:1406 stop:2605 length:1200 start_codon:yes stop_codon:yes gene_type:complete
MTQKFIPYGRQSIDQDDIEAIVKVLKSDYLTTGPAVNEFEGLLADKTSSNYAIVCNSGTAALHMAAHAIGLSKNDAAIVPSVTFLASANAMTFTGAKVIFADCDPATGLMTKDHLENAILRAKKAGLCPKVVVPVHLAGQLCDMEAISKVARREGMFVIEDACHAIGTTYGPNLEHVAGDCKWSDLTAFSFHPVKTIAMGEGGAVTTNSSDFAKKLELFRNHGITRKPEEFISEDAGKDRSGEWGSWYYEMSQPGYNYRASDIQCALGSSQLKKLDMFAAKRRELREKYYSLENSLPEGIRLANRVPNCSPCPHLMIALFDNDFLGKGRNHVMEKLKNDGIGTQVHYIPVHLQPYYRTQTVGVDFSGTLSFYNSCLSLPIHTSMSPRDIEAVVSSLKSL